MANDYDLEFLRFNRSCLGPLRASPTIAAHAEGVAGWQPRPCILRHTATPPSAFVDYTALIAANRYTWTGQVYGVMQSEYTAGRSY